MKYVSGEEILILHSELIDETGGSHGVRDAGLLISIVEKSKMQFDGKELYKGVFIKAATYLESIAKFHIFVDGNKRTAITVSARFLFLNGYELMATNKQVEDFVINVVVKKFDLKKIAVWIKKHSRKLK